MHGIRAQKFFFLFIHTVGPVPFIETTILSSTALIYGLRNSGWQLFSSII